MDAEEALKEELNRHTVTLITCTKVDPWFSYFLTKNFHYHSV